jgi:hypothetical protein
MKLIVTACKHIRRNNLRVIACYNNLLVEIFEVEPEFEGGKIKEEKLDKF